MSQFAELLKGRDFTSIINHLENYSSQVIDKVGIFSYADYLRSNLDALKKMEKKQDKKIPSKYREIKEIALITDSCNCLCKIYQKLCDKRSYD